MFLSILDEERRRILPSLEWADLDLADISDIGCMKLSAITGRGTMKDHVDLYFILQQIPLKELLALCAVKLPQLDRALILKALVFLTTLTMNRSGT